MAALSVRPSPLLKILAKPLTLASPLFRRTFCSLSSSLSGRSSLGCHPSTPASTRAIRSLGSSATSTVNPFTIADSEEALTGFVTGRKRATEAAHLVWKSIIRKGDTVIDATCGNGHDTLALVKMVADEFGTGCVYAMDIQNAALESTRYLLEAEAEENERKLVKLILLCHSKMEDIVPRDISVRVVSFNLGYLPGGDKTFITRSPTTLSALEAASRILARGGLISILAYVGHPGGRDEFETVQSFASSLPVESWITCKLERLNQSAAPVLVFLYKR